MRTGVWESNSAVTCTGIFAKSTIYGVLARAYFTEVSARNAMPGASLRSEHAEASVNHARRSLQMMYLTERSEKPCQQKTFLRSVSRKLPKTMPQRSAIAAHLTEASEKHGANGYPCGISHGKTSAQGTAKRTICGSVCGRLRETNRFETTARSVMRRFRVMGRHSGNLWHVVRKVPRNTPRRNPEMAYLTEASEKQATNKAQNSTSKRP